MFYLYAIENCYYIVVEQRHYPRGRQYQLEIILAFYTLQTESSEN